MKKIFALLIPAAALLSLLASACNKESEGPLPEGQTTITITATYGNDATRVAYSESGNAISATWQDGDQIYVVYNGHVNKLDLTSGAGTTSATFEGAIVGTPKATSMLICYVKDQNTPTGNVTVDDDGSYIYSSDAFLSQDGTLESAASCNLYYGSTFYGDGTNLSVGFSVNTSIMKFTLQDINHDKGKTASISYMSGDTELCRATFTVVEGDNTVYMSIPSGKYSGKQSIGYECANGLIFDSQLSATQANFTAGQTYSKVWTNPLLGEPLTFEAKQAGAQVSFSGNEDVNWQYRLNDEPWYDYTIGSVIILYNEGDKVAFRGDNQEGFNGSNSDKVGKFTCYRACYLYGNIMSLLSSDNYATMTTLPSSHVFRMLFYTNTNIYSLSSKPLWLPATTLTESCYESLFLGCFNLTTAPDLPATTLQPHCYSSMFQHCRNLAIAPDLPATTLQPFCYSSMFYGCSNLTIAPDLPATTLQPGCYLGMFSNCSNLTIAPDLPATTLQPNCYLGMFSTCSNLTIAPDLPATTLVVGCYSRMFYGCSSLNSVTCLATDISASYCTYDWLYGVAASGTFTNASSMTDWTLNSASGIPEGWTVAFPIGILGGKFSVNSSGDQVYFSRGNLQYQASTNIWRFAPNQYDSIGGDNHNISSSYSGWIDLFGWGTGSDPTQTSTSNDDYSTFTDWGGNAIANGGNLANSGWRTMTKEEWSYLFSGRANNMGIISYVRCAVNGVNGYIVLPDDWNQSYYSFTSYNNPSISFSTNQISLSEWTDCIKPYGALFLPVSGYREGTEVQSADTNGDYWSSSNIGDDNASHVMFTASSGASNHTLPRYTGMAVRLVRNVN